MEGIGQKEHHHHEGPISFENLAVLLSKKDKSPIDCEVIYQKIQAVKGFNIFIEGFLKGLSQEQIIQLCSKFQYKKYFKGDIIFRQGDAHDNKLYLILSGSVLIFINRSLDDENPVQEKDLKLHVLEEKKKILMRQVTNKLDKGNIHLSIAMLAKLKGLSKNALAFSQKKKGGIFSLIITQEEKEILMKKYGNTTRTLLNGSFFGEKALLNNDCRSATIIVDNHHTEMITLEKKYFKECLNQLLEITLARKQVMTNIFPEFNEFTQQKLDNMLYCFRYQQFTKGMHLCFQGAKEDLLFIIQDGEVQLEKTVIINNQLNHQFPSQESIEKTNTKSIDSTLKKKNKTISFQISILSTGGIIGEEIFSGQNAEYEYTCTVLSPTATILIGEKGSIGIKFPNNLIVMLNKMWEQKEKMRKQIIQNRVYEILELENSSKKDFQINHPEKLLQQSSSQTPLTAKRQTSKTNHTVDLNYDINNRNNQVVAFTHKGSVYSSQNIQDQLKSELLHSEEDQLDLIAQQQLQNHLSLQASFNHSHRTSIHLSNNGQYSTMSPIGQGHSQVNTPNSSQYLEPTLPGFDFGNNTLSQNALKKKAMFMKSKQKAEDKPKVPIQNIDLSKKFIYQVQNQRLEFLSSTNLMYQNSFRNYLNKQDKQEESNQKKEIFINKHTQSSYFSPEIYSSETLIKSQQAEWNIEAQLKSRNKLTRNSQNKPQASQGVGTASTEEIHSQNRINNTPQELFSSSGSILWKKDSNECLEINNQHSKEQKRLFSHQLSLQTEKGSLINNTKLLFSPQSKPNRFYSFQLDSPINLNHPVPQNLTSETANSLSSFRIKRKNIFANLSENPLNVKAGGANCQLERRKTASNQPAQNSHQSNDDPLQIECQDRARTGTSPCISDSFPFVHSTLKTHKSSFFKPTLASEIDLPPSSSNNQSQIPTVFPVKDIKSTKNKIHKVIDIATLNKSPSIESYSDNTTNSLKQDETTENYFFQNNKNKEIEKVSIKIQQSPLSNASIQQKKNIFLPNKTSNSFGNLNEEQSKCIKQNIFTNRAFGSQTQSNFSQGQHSHNLNDSKTRGQDNSINDQSTSCKAMSISSKSTQEAFKNLIQPINKGKMQQGYPINFENPIKIFQNSQLNHQMIDYQSITSFCYSVDETSQAPPHQFSQQYSIQSPLVRNSQIHYQRLKQFKDKQTSLGSRKLNSEISKIKVSPRFEIQVNHHKEFYSPKQV